MTRRVRIIGIVVAPILSAFVLLLLPPAFALVLQIPAALVLQKAGLSGTVAVITSLVVDWFLLTLLAGAFYIGLISESLVSRLCVLVTLLLLVIFYVVGGRPEYGKTYTGLYEHGFERSAFYPNGQCWRPSYWVDAMPELDLPKDSSAVEVTFIGDTTSIGSHGHLGGYIRETRVIKVLAAKPAAPCR